MKIYLKHCKAFEQLLSRRVGLQVSSLTLGDVKTKAELISQSKFLTDEDFKKIQQKSLSQQMGDGARKGKKRKATTTVDTTSNKSNNKSELVDLSSIEN